MVRLQGTRQKTLQPACYRSHDDPTPGQRRTLERKHEQKMMAGSRCPATDKRTLRKSMFNDMHMHAPNTYTRECIDKRETLETARQHSRERQLKSAGILHYKTTTAQAVLKQRESQQARSSGHTRASPLVKPWARQLRASPLSKPGNGRVTEHDTHRRSHLASSNDEACRRPTAVKVAMLVLRLLRDGLGFRYCNSCGKEFLNEVGRMKMRPHFYVMP